MKTIEVKRREVDRSALRLRPARESDFTRVVAEPTIITEDGEPQIVYADWTEPVSAVLRGLGELRLPTAISYRSRSAGLLHNARSFGFNPRIAFRQDFCCKSVLASEQPALHQELECWAGVAAAALAQYVPKVHAVQTATVTERVKPEWWLPGGAFTSGIINSNSALAYHTDAGNFRDLWSAMVVLTRDMPRGGALSVPEYDTGFDFRRSSPTLFIFNGQKLIHGVTPIARAARGYRYSIVFYALRGMCRCGTRDEELARIRLVKTEREVRRLDPMAQRAAIVKAGGRP
jgi:hypothetical protein